MGKYVFVYYGGTDSSDVSMEESMAAWNKWFGELGDKIIDAGNPFNLTGKTVDKSGVSDVKSNPVTGYSIVKADSIEAASEIAKGCPLVGSGDSLQVYEAMPM